MKNVTLSVPDGVLEKARAVAHRRGTSLNALVREFLADLAGKSRGARAARELQKLWADGRGGNSGGRKIRREEAYEGRI